MYSAKDKIDGIDENIQRLQNVRKQILRSNLENRLELADEILYAIDYLQRATPEIVAGASHYDPWCGFADSLFNPFRFF